MIPQPIDDAPLFLSPSPAWSGSAAALQQHLLSALHARSALTASEWDKHHYLKTHPNVHVEFVQGLGGYINVGLLFIWMGNLHSAACSPAFDQAARAVLLGIKSDKTPDAFSSSWFADLDCKTTYLLPTGNHINASTARRPRTAVPKIDIGLAFYSARMRMLITLPCRCFKNPSIMTFNARSCSVRYSDIQSTELVF